MNREDVLSEIKTLKNELKDDVVILGHHYQQNDVIQFADIRGDSLGLAQQVSKIDKKYIVFCGVHFMAETADMLAKDYQKVILPDLEAGCSMADMASRKEVEIAWSIIEEATDERIVPVTYVNCTAELKAFVGEKQGSICTSSNAEKIISWALDQGDKLMFFPDQHLGRNTCSKLGISLDDMVIYNPHEKNGGLTAKDIRKAKVILWYGDCCVHQEFTKEQIDDIRKNSPNTKVIVHPECCYDVFKNADLAGSTSYIIDVVKDAPSGSKFAIGTETNLVYRLAGEFTDKTISSLAPEPGLCLCASMYKISPERLLESLKSIKDGVPMNVIRVEESVKAPALCALEAMLSI